MQPNDYTSAFANLPSPVESFMNSFKMGASIRQIGLQQDEQEMKMQQERMLQADLQEISMNPTPGAIARISIKYPQLSEQFKRSFDMLSPEEQKAKINAAMPVYAAVQANQPEIAVKTLRDRAVALENSGQVEEAQQTRVMADLIELSPETGGMTAGMLLSSAMGPEKFAETFGKLGAEERAAEQAPADLREKEAKATTAEVNAKYAEPQALVNLEKDGWYIENVKSEIKYRDQQSRIAAMQASLAREGNELKRQELALKIQEAKQKLDSDIRTKVADVETARSTIDNLLNTVDRIKKNPALKDVVGSIEGGSMYPNAAAGLVNPFGSGADERSDVIALIESLGSQSSLAQLPAMRGTGSITDKEQEILRTSLQNLSRKQSEAQFMTNLGEVQRIMLKARKVVTTKYGVPESVPDTPAAAPAANDIDALVQKYAPGAK